MLLPSLLVRAQEITVSRGAVNVHLNGYPKEEHPLLQTLVREQLEFSPDNAASAPLADDLAYFTRLHLINHGWKSAVVQWQLDASQISLNCTAGSPRKLGQVRWSGDTAPVPAKELEALLLRPLQETHGKLDLPWVEQSVQSGASLVQRRLQAEGYLDARATLTSTESASSMNADIAITLGKRTMLATVAIEGAPPEHLEEIQNTASRLEGRPCNFASLESAGRTITALLQKQGWLGASVEVKTDAVPLDGKINATLKISSGPRTLITDVSVAENLSAGAQRVLYATFRPLEGRIWNTAEIELHFRRALDSGLFSKLEHSAEPIPGANPEPDGTIAAVLRLSGEESRRYQFGVHGGFDTFLGSFVGAEISGLNLNDSGSRWRFAADYGFFGPAGALSITDPAVFNSGFSGTGELAIQHVIRDEYVSTTLGGKMLLDRRVSLPFSYSLYTTLLFGSASTTTLLPSELGPDSYGTAQLGASFLYDRRDSPVLPTKGWMTEGRLDAVQLVSNFSDISYARAELAASWIHTFSNGLKWASGANWTAIGGPDTEKVPIELRLFNGGAHSVRSFQEREMGARSRSGGTALGGTMATTISAELSREIMSNLDVAIFADAGGIGLDGNILLPEDWRYAVGLGLRYKLPFGPLRVDYGWNPNQRSGEKMGTLHVALGFPF
jgi:outer membrane protein assembly factor BamA